MEPKRLNKFISDSGFCSRREADRLIEEGRVTVNGKTPDAGTKVTPKDKVRIDDQMLRVREEEPVFLAFNKPAGISTKTDPTVKDNIVRAINYPASLQPIGHLDRDGEGLIFLSNDSDLVRKLARTDNKMEKEYVVRVDKLITPEFLDKVSYTGPPEFGEAPRKHFVVKEGQTKFRIVLEPNTDHHIKSICEALGYKVTYLQRTRIQHITIAKLPSGHWRTMAKTEVDALLETVPSGRSGRSPEYKKVDTADFRRKERTERTGGTKRSDTSDSKARVGKSRVERPGASSSGRGSKQSMAGPKSAPKGAAKSAAGKGSAATRSSASKPGGSRGATQKGSGRGTR